MWLDLGDYHGPGHLHSLVMYMAARTLERAKRHSFRVYVTECLRLAPQGMTMDRPWHEVVRPREEIDVDAIIERVAAAIGG